MSAFENLFDLQEQICYVQCGYCTTILLVNVPYTNLSMVVTVRCGHCTSILSVDMAKYCFTNSHFVSAPNRLEDVPKQEMCSVEEATDKKVVMKRSATFCFSSDEEDYDYSLPVNQVIPKLTAPEKKQRVPSAYNNFIKEEIKRLKTVYPDMTHKQAFSTASKNWALSPQVHYKGCEVQGCDESDRNMPMCSYADKEWFPGTESDD